MDTTLEEIDEENRKGEKKWENNLCFIEQFVTWMKEGIHVITKDVSQKLSP